LSSEGIVRLLERGADPRMVPLGAMVVARDARRGSISALRSLLEDPSLTDVSRAFVVAALVHLGDRERARDLVQLASADSTAMPYAAAVLLDDEIVPRRDAAAALASSLSAGDAGQRETRRGSSTRSTAPLPPSSVASRRPILRPPRASPPGGPCPPTPSGHARPDESD
jgi:hypothetical protein